MTMMITKMSANGQIVIPVEIRRAAKLKPSTKFAIFYDKGNIFLRKITKEYIKQEIALMKRIAKAEENIKKGNYVSIDADLPAEEIDKILMNS
jgi:AbrB family looped-hinge helix DNA binding protein